MATAEQLKALIRSHAVGDDDRFYSVALQVAARAAHQGHGRYARDLKALVDQSRKKTGGLRAVAHPGRESEDPAPTLLANGDVLMGLTPGTYLKHDDLPFDPRKFYGRFRLTWIDDPSGSDGGVSLATDIPPYGEVTSGASFPGFGRSHGEVQDVPGPLPLLGAGAALGWSRRLRARVKASRPRWSHKPSFPPKPWPPSL